MTDATPTPRQLNRAKATAAKRRERFAQHVVKDRKRRAADLFQVVNLRENPNSAKRRAARLADPASGRTCDHGRHYISEVTPATDSLGRRNPRMRPSETIRTARGRVVLPAAPVLRTS